MTREKTVEVYVMSKIGSTHHFLPQDQEKVAKSTVGDTCLPVMHGAVQSNYSLTGSSECEHISK